jgi:hypothetical protein
MVLFNQESKIQFNVMTERLLQYLWQFQYFNCSSLQSTMGEELLIMVPGKLNRGQGPDFLDAQIRVDGTLLAGSVELHVCTSQWMEHGHTGDPNYKNVILHVVYHHDGPESPGLPILELQPLVPKLLLERYESLMESPAFIPCAHSLNVVHDLVWTSWKERLLAERLTRKAVLIRHFNQKNQDHWEETFWWMLARNFGMKTNAESFEAIARSIPLNILSRHRNLIQQVEALLFGQAGLLGNRFHEDYPRLLHREYQFLKKKYKLQPIHLPIHFLRMRPVNFPTIRLAQLAALIHREEHLFSRLLEEKDLGKLRKILAVTANDYWHYHYLLDESSEFQKKTLGKSMIENLLINTFIPVIFAYGLHRNDEQFTGRAVQWLESLSAERNAITEGFSQLQLGSHSAKDSQALIELKTQYCDQKRCLACAVGNSILKSG